jgi:hypothetical protein
MGTTIPIDGGTLAYEAAGTGPPRTCHPSLKAPCRSSTNAPSLSVCGEGTNQDDEGHFATIRQREYTHLDSRPAAFAEMRTFLAKFNDRVVALF